MPLQQIYSPCVSADVEVKLCLGQVLGDRVTGKKNRTSRVASEALLELVEEGLVSETPAVDLVGDGRIGRPCEAVVCGSIDGEPSLASRVVLPGAKQRSGVL